MADAGLTQDEARVLGKVLKGAAKPVAPDTSAMPPNVSDADIAKEIKQRMKNVLRAIGEKCSYLMHQGWRTRVEVEGTHGRILFWHVSESEDPNDPKAADRPPKFLASQSVDDRHAEISAENIRLTSALEDMTIKYEQEKAKPKAESAEGETVEEPEA